MVIPRTMTTNFLRLNLWPSELSKRITVEICSNTPITIALIKTRLSTIKPKERDRKVPMGVINAKSKINNAEALGLSFDPKRKKLKMMAIAILWIKIP